MEEAEVEVVAVKGVDMDAAGLCPDSDVAEFSLPVDLLTSADFSPESLFAFSFD